MAQQYVELAIEQIPPMNNIAFEKIDIALDDELLNKYGLTIPVLQRADDHLELNWPFTVLEIQSMINP
jgi:hypothetical protein